ncbi:PEGA domain-containing protein [Hyalangium gracile]|uniref:PEGA domain-containing protein n=1 Tax=Hyalangium gracile TaxID=394092 RepID=UPI001CCDAFBD|nr:PEGA domain-containing protein [Hyalangium gracile]
MRTFGLPLTGLLTLSLMLLAPSAGAQQEEGGMGLDLSGSDENQEAPAGGDEQPGSIGLDLSGEVANSDLLPRVVILGLDTPERAGAAVASRWLKGLYVSARSNEKWVLSSPLKEVREKLGDGYTAALQCAESACMAEPAETLDADLLVTSRLALEDEGWTFRLWIFDRDRNRVEMDFVTGRNPKDAKFQKAAAELLEQRLPRLARQRATLAVKVNVPQAVVRLGEKTLGVGSLERNVAPGEPELIVEADGFTSYNKPVTLKSGEKTEVAVYLELTGTSADGPSEVAAEALETRKESSMPAVFSRPALYTAVVGALAMGAGVVVGMQAKNIADRAPDGDGNGISDITRKERIDGQNQANLSTALLTGGAAVVGGSVLWLVIMPTRSEAPKAAPSVAPGAASGGTTSSTALHLLFGGSF